MKCLTVLYFYPAGRPGKSNLSVKEGNCVFKVFGILLLAACPAAAGFLLAGAKSKRIAQLQAALVLLGALEQYISYETATLSEITYKLKEDARFHVLGLSMLDTHRRDAAAALCACFQDNPALCLEQQDVQLLCINRLLQIG